MKALLCKAHGPPESLVLEDIESPPPGKSEVKIRVRACGVNFPDVLLIRDKYQFKPSLPFSPGGEVAGDVVETGSEVQRFRAGDRVIAMTGWNGFREEVIATEDKVMPLPTSMSYEVGAGFTLTYGTSYHALVDRGALREGETLLVLGAAGGVGTAAIDIGRILGARIIAAAGTDEKLDRLKEIYGIEHCINYRSLDEPLKERVKKLTGGSGADVIYDPVGGDAFQEALRSVAWRGRILVVGFASDENIPAAKANLLLLKGSSLIGVFWGRYAAMEPANTKRDFERLFQWHSEGRLRPHISHRFPLERGADALYALINREVIGKCVVTID